MKNYFVVGASSGIGQALCNKLINNGNTVFGTYKNTPVSDSFKNLHLNYLDVMEDTLNLEYLPDQLDGLVYCPGSINLKPFHRIKPAAFLEDYQLQVMGAIKIIQATLVKLKKSKAASVVLFSTVAVQTGFPFHSQVAASKGAIEGIAKALAAEYATNIRFNVIAPSLTDTPLASKLLSSDEKKEANAKRHPLQRIGTPSDIANMAAFLLNEQSSWMTGQVISVDGGMSSIRK